MIHPEYDRLKKLVDEHLSEFLPDIDSKSAVLEESMSYSLLAGGKRFRPVLLLAATELCGGSTEFALPFACAVEYIQTYSLIHDDLPAMDDDDLRRGQPSNHIAYGEALAILAGDGLLSAAYEVMTKDMLLYLDDPCLLRRKVRAAFEISKGIGCRGMVAGQVADVESVSKQCSKEMLDYIHLNKTASFIASAALAGCYLGGGDKDRCNDLITYGEAVGLAFQIVDDIVDVKGKVAALGKLPGSDCKRGKCTFPSLYGFDESRDKALSLLGKARGALEKYFDEAEIFNGILDYLAKQLD